MYVRCFISGILVAILLLALPGCKPKEDKADAYASGSAPPDMAQTIRALTRGLQPIAVANVSKPQHIGRRCVVVARTPERRDPPPPPLGMVRLMGPTIVYTAEIHDVSADAIEIKADYPSSDMVKIVAIPKADIQSIHLGE